MDDLNRIESQIENLEEKKAEFENLLNDESLYSNPSKIKEVTANYDATKTDLKIAYEQWDLLTEKLEAIEAEFNL